MIKIYKKHLFNIFSISILEVCGIFFTLVFILGFLEEINFFRNYDILKGRSVERPLNH